MDVDGDRNGVNVDLSTDPANTGNTGNTGGNDGNTGNTGGNGDNTDTTDNTGSTDTTDNTDVTDTTGGTDDTDTSDSSDTTADSTSGDSDESNAQYLLIGVLAVLAGGLFFLSRNGGDELNLNQEAHIEKMWDDDTLDGAIKTVTKETGFVPAPPPVDAIPFWSGNEEE